ncbi:hypothetical protein V2O64_21175 [Verrucomicrobiaceae bacterium 227]
MRFHVLPSVAILLGLAGGFAARNVHPPTPSSPSPQVSTPQSKISLPPPTLQNSTLTLQDLSQNSHHLAQLYLFLHQATPQELIAHWQTLLEDKDTTEESLTDFTSLWVQRDPETALHHLSESKFQDLYWWTLARHDPQKALALADPDNTELYAKILHAIGTTDPDLAISLFKEDLGKDHITALGGIIAGLFERNPAEALDFAFQHRSRYNYHLGEHLTKWATHSPHEAFAWALAHPEIHSETLPSIGSILFERDPEFITNELAKLPAGNAKTSLLRSQAIHLAQSDPHAALAFAQSQPPYLQKEILRSLGHTIAQTDSGLALDVLSQIFTQELDSSANTSSASPFDGSPPVTINKWAKELIREKPQAVIKLASEADADASPSFSTSRQVLSVWLDQNPTSAQQWLDQQAPGDSRDHLYSQSLSQLGFDDPKNLSTHLNLSQKIENPELRQNTLNELFNWLASEHDDKLDSFLQDHQFTPEQQEAYDQRDSNE